MSGLEGVMNVLPSVEVHDLTGMPLLLWLREGAVRRGEVPAQMKAPETWRVLPVEKKKRGAK
jgi:hypothetical protein